METITSADGTSIAFERKGSGPALVLCSGSLTDRKWMAPLAEKLSGHFTVFNFDRRGRGDSGDSVVDPQREIEDVAALIEAAGGHAHAYGHSSGGGLAFYAAAAGLNIDRLVLHEPPFQEEASAGTREYSRKLTAILAEGDGAEEAVELFLSAIGEDAIEAMKGTPEWDGYVRLGRSLAWDSAGMHDSEGGQIPYADLDKVTMPTMMLEGTESFEFMTVVGKEMAQKLPNGTFMPLEGADHEATPELIAPAVIEFLEA